MKTISTLLTLMTGIGLALGQGTVNFNNNEAVGGNHLVYSDVVGGTKLVGTNWCAQLYYGAAGTAESALTPLASSISRFRPTTTSVPGAWSGKSVTLPMGGVGVPLTLEIKVWDLNLFASYDAAVAGGGQTGTSGTYTFTQASSIPPAGSDTQMVTSPAFALVPEPSAIALSVMGVAGLLLIRRRK